MFSELNVAFIFGFSNVELMASFLKPVQNFIKAESKNEFPRFLRLKRQKKGL